MVGWRRCVAPGNLLRVVQASLILAIGAVVYRAVAREPLTVAPAVIARAETSGPAGAEAAKPLDWYAVIWQRDLRQPPIPPEAKPVPAEPQKPPPNLPQLLGTFVEPQDRWAHFLTADGRLRVCRVDQEVGGYRVMAIEPGKAQLAHGSNAHWLEVPRRKEDR